MRLSYFFSLAIFSISILAPFANTADAKSGGYMGSSSFYRSQQLRRSNQQMMQNQRRMQRQRQQQANARRQQEIARNRVAQQRRIARERQQRALKQRQKSFKRKAPMYKGGYVSKLKIKRPLQTKRQPIGKKYKANQKQKTLRSQRLMKDRRDRLRRLKNDRLRKKGADKKKKASSKPMTMAALTLRQSSNLSKGFKPLTQKQSIKQFQKTRVQQKNKQRVIKRFEAQRKVAQVRMQKIRKFQNRLHRKKISTAKNQKKIKVVQKLAQKNFSSCNSGACSIKTPKESRIGSTTRVSKSNVARAPPPSGENTKKGKVDFVVSRDGAVVPNSPAAARRSLEKAGFIGKSTSGNEAGTIHRVPNMKMDVRVMDGGSAHPPRTVTTRQGTNQPVNPYNGSNFGNTPRSEQRTRSHIPFTK